jgi:hypothetical protein
MQGNQEMGVGAGGPADAAGSCQVQTVRFSERHAPSSSRPISTNLRPSTCSACRARASGYFPIAWRFHSSQGRM